MDRDEDGDRDDRDDRDDKDDRDVGPLKPAEPQSFLQTLMRCSNDTVCLVLWGSPGTLWNPRAHSHALLHVSTIPMTQQHVLTIHRRASRSHRLSDTPQGATE